MKITRIRGTVSVPKPGDRAMANASQGRRVDKAIRGVDRWADAYCPKLSNLCSSVVEYAAP